MEFYLILILYLITLFVIYKLASRFIDVELQKNKIKSDELIKDTKIDNTGLDVLDSLINDVLEEYAVFEIKTKNVININEISHPLIISDLELLYFTPSAIVNNIPPINPPIWAKLSICPPDANPTIRLRTINGIICEVITFPK